VTTDCCDVTSPYCLAELPGNLNSLNENFRHYSSEKVTSTGWREKPRLLAEVSQNGAKKLQGDAIINLDFITHLLRCLMVRKILKSVGVWRTYGQA